MLKLSLVCCLAFHVEAGGSLAARNFLLLRQKKVTKEMATRSLGHCACATGTLHCSEGTEILETCLLRSLRTSKIFSSVPSCAAQPSQKGVGEWIEFGNRPTRSAGLRTSSSCPFLPSPPNPWRGAKKRRLRQIRAGTCLSRRRVVPDPA